MKALVILLFAGVAAAAADLPDGHGKDELVRRCSKCHSPDTVADHRQTQEDWELTLEKMASFGAEATDDEYNAIVEYLVKNFGPQSAKINLNKAAAKEIENGLSLSAKEAEAIVQYRTEKGAFKSLDDLKNVPGVEYAKIEKKKEKVTF